MDLFEAIENRHCYRGAFKNAPVPREHLQKIVQAGLQAPSGCNAQTTTFVIVDDPDIINEIATILDKSTLKTAKAAIVCVMETRDVYHGASFGVEDCSTATQNMLLALTAFGYASVWLDGALRLDGKAEKIAKLLNVPAKREVRIVLPVGVPEEPVVAREKLPFEARAWFNKHG